MRLDLHSHTKFSPDSRTEPRELVAAARRLGLDGLAITDHNAVAGIEAAREAAAPGFLLIPGTEVSTHDGHVLALGVRETVPRSLPVSETIDRIVALGGVPVAAHPYRFWSGLGEASTIRARFPAYETANARTLRRGNVRAQILAQAQIVGVTGGSDAHFLDEIGGAITFIDEGVTDVDSVLEAIVHARTRAQGSGRGAGGTVRYVTKCVGEWFLRGMRRI